MAARGVLSGGAVKVSEIAVLCKSSQSQVQLWSDCLFHVKYSCLCPFFMHRHYQARPNLASLWLNSSVDHELGSLLVNLMVIQRFDPRCTHTAAENVYFHLPPRLHRSDEDFNRHLK